MKQYEKNFIDIQRIEHNIVRAYELQEEIYHRLMTLSEHLHSARSWAEELRSDLNSILREENKK